MIYTAQYRYAGQDRLDITVKGNDLVGKTWAPTWDLVMGLKNNNITEDEYSAQYYELLNQRWGTTYNAHMRVFVTTAQKADITVVCFCRKDTFCHRYLMVRWLNHNFQVPYGGERDLG